MTGYARAQGSDERRRWVWEARSVNGRNLEIRCRVPQGFDRLENPARNAVGSKLKRGNVSLTDPAGPCNEPNGICSGQRACLGCQCG